MYSSLQLPVVQLKALDHQKMSALKILANVYCDEVPSNDDDNNDVIHDIYTDLEHKSFDTMMLYFAFAFEKREKKSSGGCGLFQMQTKKN